MKLNNKGFSFVELLAAVAILAILSSIAIVGVSNILDKSHKEYYNNERKNLTLAAQAYMNENKSELPKVVGKKIKLEANKLKEANYLKKDIKTYNGKYSCMDSYVTVFKYGQSDYSYVGYIDCERGEKDAYKDPANVSPTFDVYWPGSNQDVALSSVQLTIRGGSEYTPVNLISYSYSISIIEGSTPKELVNSGNKTYRSQVLNKNVSLAKYTIKGTARMLVKMTATNINGVTKTQVFLRNFKDDTPPKCIIKTADMPNTPEGKKPWVNTKRTITIGCDDGNGSGCEKSSYTKTFTANNIVDYITIKDNAGKSKRCEVTTYIDKTKPKVVATAYKCDSNGNATGGSVGTITAQEDKTWSSSSFTGNVNGWLNKTNYPNGVCFVFEVTDNLALKDKTWRWNTANQKNNNSGYTTLTGGPTSDTNINKDQYITNNFVNSKTYKHSLTAEGHRYAEFYIKDDRGNEVTLKMDIKIDRTKPSAPKVAGYKKANATNVSSESGLSGYTFDQWYKGWVLTKAHSSTDAISGFDAYYLTTSGQSTDVTDSKQVYRNVNVEEKSVTIKYRAKDVAGNWSDYTERIVKLDRKAHDCTFETATDECDTDGVNVKINCTDPGKGLKKCAGSNKSGDSAQVSKTDITSTTEYTVEDGLGNTATCSFTIHTDTQYKKRSCGDCGECSSAGCAQCTSCTYQSGTFTWSCDTDTEGDSCGSGHAGWCTYLGRGAGYGTGRNSVISYSCPNYETGRNCSECGCDYYNTSCPTCGCSSWNSWSDSWSVNNACNSTKKSENRCDDKHRTVYRHKSSSCP